MEILSSILDGILHLHLVGDFDARDVARLRARVEAAVEAQHTKLVVNASRMRSINSAALGALLRARKRVRDRGGDLALAEIPDYAARMFRTMALDRVFRCFASEAEAREWLNGV